MLRENTWQLRSFFSLHENCMQGQRFHQNEPHASNSFEFVNSFFMATRWRIASMRRFSLSNKSSGNPSLMKQPKIYEAQKLHTKAKSAHLMQMKCPPKCSCIQRNQKHAHQMNLSHSSKTSYFINGVRANGVAYWMQSSCGIFWNVKNLLYIFLQSHTHTLWSSLFCVFCHCSALWKLCLDYIMSGVHCV